MNLFVGKQRILRIIVVVDGTILSSLEESFHLYTCVICCLVNHEFLQRTETYSAESFEFSMKNASK